MNVAKNNSQAVRTNIPARMDRLPWSRWHWLVVIALGITWILDGLEVTIVGSIASVLKYPQTLHLSDAQIGFAATAYLIGAVLGALFFGRLTDMLGRKKLFMITLGVYLGATILTAFSFNFFWFAACRFLTGSGIGGEYAAINSAIDELIPARVRGWADLAINSTWWVGTAFGAAATVILLNPHLLPVDLGWRLAFGMGAVLGFAILLVRHFVPESPRWLMMHGRFDEADEVVAMIEREVMKEDHITSLPEPEGSIMIRAQGTVSFKQIARTMFRDYPKRSLLGFSLMVGQAFLYNAIFFTYIISGVLLAITGWLFWQGTLNAVTQTICWSIIFFFASAGASSAYLTVSEIFPLETRALAIAFFYAIGTGAGGAAAPYIFGLLIQSGKAVNVFYGDLFGALLMAAAGVVAIFFGINAERQSLESVARPLSSVDEEETGSESVADSKAAISR